MIKNLQDLLEQAKKTRSKKKIVMVAGEDLDALEVIEEATRLRLAKFIIVGDEKKIRRLAIENNKECGFDIVNECDNKKAAEKAVEIVKSGEASAIMKGLIRTDTFSKAVLNKEKGLNTGARISQITVFDKEYGYGLQLLTDCAMAIEPTLDEKIQIIENAVCLALKLGYFKPRVALLSAIEIVNMNVKDTVEAAVISKMADRGQIKNAFVDGPFALDNAISPDAAEHKGVTGKVAGRADILIVPNFQVGNALAKSLTYYAKKESAAAIMGAAVPVIMNSRTDTVKNKLNSIALASYIWERN